MNVIAINCKIIWSRNELRNWLDYIFEIEVKRHLNWDNQQAKLLFFFEQFELTLLHLKKFTLAYLFQIALEIM